MLAYFTVSLFDTDVLTVSENDIIKENILWALQNDHPFYDVIMKRKIDGFFMINFCLSFLTLITTVVNSVNMMKGDQLGIKQKMVLYISYTFQVCSRIIPLYLVIFATIRGPLSFSDIFSRSPYYLALSSNLAMLWLFLPLGVHLAAQYLICYITAAGFKELKIFDQILHILINLFIVIPLRTEAKDQVDKARQIIWSFILHISEEIIILVNIFILLPTNTWIFALYPLLAVGPLTSFLFYNNCHTFREINREKRAVSKWGPRYCCSGYLGFLIFGLAAGVISLMLLSQWIS